MTSIMKSAVGESSIINLTSGDTSVKELVEELLDEDADEDSSVEDIDDDEELLKEDADGRTSMEAIDDSALVEEDGGSVFVNRYLTVSLIGFI